MSREICLEIAAISYLFPIPQDNQMAITIPLLRCYGPGRQYGTKTRVQDSQYGTLTLITPDLEVLGIETLSVPEKEVTLLTS